MHRALFKIVPPNDAGDIIIEPLENENYENDFLYLYHALKGDAIVDRERMNSTDTASGKLVLKANGESYIEANKEGLTLIMEEEAKKRKMRTTRSSSKSKEAKKTKMPEAIPIIQSASSNQVKTPVSSPTRTQKVVTPFSPSDDHGLDVEKIP